MMQKRKRIVLTGGPGGGKTTALDLLQRELGNKVVVVPEAATILFAGGFPRSQHADANRAVQTAIFHVQRNLENVQSALYPERALLCDRGTVDGAAYWQDGEEAARAVVAPPTLHADSAFDVVSSEDRRRARRAAAAGERLA